SDTLRLPLADLGAKRFQSALGDDAERYSEDDLGVLRIGEVSIHARRQRRVIRDDRGRVLAADRVSIRARRRRRAIRSCGRGRRGARRVSNPRSAPTPSDPPNFPATRRSAGSFNPRPATTPSDTFMVRKVQTKTIQFQSAPGDDAERYLDQLQQLGRLR